LQRRTGNGKSAAAAGDAVGIAVDEMRLAARPPRPRRKIEAKLRGVWDAHALADQVFDGAAHGDRRATLRHANVERQHHLVGVAEGLQTEKFEALGRRPAHRHVGHVARRRPIDARGKAGIARIAPIGLPPRPQLELQPGADDRAVARILRRGNQPHPGVIVAHPA